MNKTQHQFFAVCLRGKTLFVKLCKTRYQAESEQAKMEAGNTATKTGAGKFKNARSQCVVLQSLKAAWNAEQVEIC